MSQSSPSASRSRLLRAAIVLAVMLIASVLTLGIDSPASAASGWNHETLDSGISTGEGLSTIYWPVYYQHHVFNSGIESSNRVLRHGWYQPGFANWNFETLDAGNSTGIASATGLWSYQHHVFNAGIESGTSVLRHGWYQPGFSNWIFETLDAGASTGTDTAYAEYLGQQHVFAHGLSPTGQDIIRHGYYDIGVGTWIFETLDEGFSGGVGISTMVWGNQLHYFNWLAGTISGLRHGWYEPGAGWKFETLIESGPLPDASPTAHSTSLASVDGNQQVWSASWAFSGYVSSPFYLKHGSYSMGSASWQFANAPLGASWRADGRAVSATEFGSKMQVFDYATSPSGSCEGLYHAVRASSSTWEVSAYSAPCSLSSLSGPVRTTASGPYPPFNQLHAFYAQAPPAIGHFWYNPG